MLFPLGPFARWDVAFKMRFEKPCGRISDVWLLSNTPILKSKTPFWLYRNIPENIIVVLAVSCLP